MSFPLFDAPLHEPSRFVGFAGNMIDRWSEKRADDSVERALADPAARLLLLRDGRICLKINGAGFEPYYSVSGGAAVGAKLEHAVLLGFNAGRPVLAAPASVDPENLPDGIKAIDYRSVYVQGLLEVPELGALAQAAALLAWHANHRFCGRCGGKTEMRAGGYKRACPGCGANHFPRTDPVAIMLTVTRERCLLGRGAHFGPGMYSALAGFIEPGE